METSKSSNRKSAAITSAVIDQAIGVFLVAVEVGDFTKAEKACRIAFALEHDSSRAASQGSSGS